MNGQNVPIPVDLLRQFTGQQQTDLMSNSRDVQSGVTSDIMRLEAQATQKAAAGAVPPGAIPTVGATPAKPLPVQSGMPATAISKMPVSDRPTFIPKAYTDTAARLAEDTPARTLVNSVIQAESSGRPNAESPKGAYGLMQLHGDLRTVGTESSPQRNILAGSRYLFGLVDKYAGDVAKALAAYNWGPTRVDAAGDQWQTRAPSTVLKYVSKVMQSWQAGSVRDHISRFLKFAPAKAGAPMQGGMAQ